MGQSGGVCFYLELDCRLYTHLLDKTNVEIRLLHFYAYHFLLVYFVTPQIHHSGKIFPKNNLYSLCLVSEIFVCNNEIILLGKELSEPIENIVRPPDIVKKPVGETQNQPVDLTGKCMPMFVG